MHVPFRRALVFGLGEGVCITVAERVFYVFLAVYVDRMTLAEVEGASVVKPSHMVHVVVGKKDGIQVPDVCRQCLLPEVGTAVHEDGQAAVFNKGGGPEAPVPWV